MGKSNRKIVYYQTDHGPEIYARSLRFTDEEKAWRKDTIKYLKSLVKTNIVRSGTEYLSDTSDITDGSAEYRRHVPDNRWFRNRLTESLQTLKIAHRILGLWFGNKHKTNCLANESETLFVDNLPSRALTRLGIFSEFKPYLDQISEDEVAEIFNHLIPSHIRDAFLLNLRDLGQVLCTPEKPKCVQCELQKFCNYYRNTRQQVYMAENRPTVIEMFSGAGGFSLGLEQAGFKIVAALDYEPNAIRTYRLNHPQMTQESILESDARKVESDYFSKLLTGKQLDLLVGGPPCQGFSAMGNRVPHKYTNGHKKFGDEYIFEEDDRNHLFRTIIQLACDLKPRYVVIENVPGLASAEIRQQSFAEHIAESLTKAGYWVRVIRLEASNFGVPQRRHRYFVMGTRYGEIIPDLGTLESMKKPMSTIEHALYDLPCLDVADGKWIDQHTEPDTDSDMYNQYLGQYSIRGQSRILYNHVTRYNNDDDIELYSYLQPGEQYTNLVDRLTEIMGERPSFTKYDTTSFHDKYYRLEWDGLSKTIVSHLSRDGNSYVHPTQNRSISVREAARLQSFPDDYIFCGSRGPQFIQIGNAVPPIMAQAIGNTVLAAISGEYDGPIASHEFVADTQMLFWDNNRD